MSTSIQISYVDPSDYFVKILLQDPNALRDVGFHSINL
jgi:hypothetical protein